jgi:hypothetical protein
MSDTIYIGKCHLFSTLIGALIGIALHTFHTVSYVEIPNKLKSELLTKLFLAYVVAGWIAEIIPILNLIKIFEHYGETIPNQLWSKIQYTSKFPWSWLKLLNTLMVCLGIYFVTVFIPFSNCSIYGDHTNICVSIRIISVMSLIAVTIFLTVLLCCLLYMCMALHACTFEPRSSFRTSISHSSVVFRTITSFLPITSIPPESGVCAICFKNSEKGDRWEELTCGHKFHPNCINPWLELRNTCPLCRKEQVGRLMPEYAV